jgi:gliding motility-associated-like protein
MKKLFTAALIYLSLNQLYAQDLALQSPFGSFSSPTTGCSLTSTETVTVNIACFGVNLPAGTTFDVSYTINAGAPVTETVTLGSTLLASSIYTHTFTTLADLSVPGAFTIDANVTLTSIADINTSNDTYVGYSVTNNAASVGGSISGDGPVCITSNTGTLTLSGETGSVIRWESSTDGGFTWVPISNTTNTYTYNNVAVATDYRVVVQNATCASTVSGTATLTIDDPSEAGTGLVKVPSSPAAVCQGSNINLTLGMGSVVGSVDHWEYSTDGGFTWTTVVNTLNSYTYTNAQPADVRFRVFVVNGSCPGDYSNTRTITVNPTTVAGAVTSDATECAGNNSAVMNLAGNTGSVQSWQISTDGGMSYTDISGTSGLTNYTYNNIIQTSLYRARVKSGQCSQQFSSPATITVVAASDGGAVTSDVTECYNSNNDTLTLSGESGSIINWEYSTDGGSTWNSIANTTNEEIYTNLTQTTQYRAAVQAGTCPVDYSVEATVTVDTLSEGGIISAPATHCSGSNGGTLTLAGNNGSITQWEYSQDGGVTWDTIVNTSSTHNYSNLTGTTYYRSDIKNGVCPVEYSDTVIITIDSLTLGGNISTNMTVCSGNNLDTLFLQNERGSVLNWEYSTDGGFIWSNITNDTTIQIINNVSQNTQYRAYVKSGVCSSEYSTPVSVSVDAQAVGGNVIGATTVCSSGNTGSLTLVGHTSIVSSWESSSDGGATWNSIANTSNIENYSNLTSTSIYRTIVSSGVCPNDTSSAATITVDTVTLGGTVTTDDTLCANSPGDTLTLAGYNGSVLNWEMSSDGGATWITLSNTTDEQIYNNLALTTMFRAQTKNGVCPSSTAVPATITINPQSEGGVVNSNATGCEGYNSGTMVLTGYQGTITDWESSTDGGTTWTSMAIDTVSSIMYTNLTDTTLFHAIVQSGNCNSDTSSIAYVTVYPKPTASFITDTVCLGNSITFTNTTTTNNGFVTLYNWNFGDNNSQIQTNPVHTYDAPGTYTVTLVAMSNFGCLDTAITTALVHDLPNSEITPAGVTVFCDGDSVLLAVIFNANFTYDWNTGDTINNVLADSSGFFLVNVTDTTTGCNSMDSVEITVYPNPIANAGPDTTISLGMSYEMQGSGGLTYLWSPGETLNDSLIAMPVAVPLETTTYILTVSDINACFDTDTVIINLDDNAVFNIPNLITPNGDGYNDKWIIENIEFFPENSILIVNRNGQVVFDMTGYDNSWDGTYNGKTLPDGTYYYVLEIDGNDNPVKGAVNIIASDR